MNVIHKHAKYLQGTSVVRFTKYYNGRTAILLTTLDGEPNATASVNLPNTPLNKEFVAMKDYSENEGLMQDLIDAGVITDPHAEVSLGFVVAPICKLTSEALALIS